MAQSDVSVEGGGEAARSTAAVPEDFDVSQRSDVAKLRRGAVGLGGVLFLTVTGAAPISAMMFNTPIVVGFGQGIGAPAAFLFATIVLGVFSVGYVAMARKKTTAGGFYSYISHGLGRETGHRYRLRLAGRLLGVRGLPGRRVRLLPEPEAGPFGVNVGWPWLALFMIALIGVLAYFDVRVSANLLAIGLISEVAILIIFDIFLFGHGNVNFAAINPVNAFKSFPPRAGLTAGAIGIGLFFAFWSWVGFEMAPNYGEESRDPKRIVPRALYISVIGLGIFYTLTSWAPLGGYSSTHAAIPQAQSDPANFYLHPPASTRATGWPRS